MNTAIIGFASIARCLMRSKYRSEYLWQRASYLKFQMASVRNCAKRETEALVAKRHACLKSSLALTASASRLQRCLEANKVVVS